MTCGEKIQKLRKEKNYTQEDLADIVNVSRQSVSRWESDIAFPETDKIIALSKLFKCSIDYLLNPENDERNLVAEKQKPSFNGKARLPLAIATICAMLLTIGLFFCNWFECSVEVGEARGMSTLDVTVLLNYYELAFYGLKVYWSYANILAMFSFILIVAAIILAILYIIFDCKQIAYVLTTINILIPIFITIALSICDLFFTELCYGVIVPVLAILFALVIYQFAVKQIRSNTIFKISPLAISTLFVTFVSLLVLAVPIISGYKVDYVGYHFNAMYTYYYLMIFGNTYPSVATNIFAFIYGLLLIASVVMSILLLVKKDDRFKKVITILNVSSFIFFALSTANLSRNRLYILLTLQVIYFLCMIFVKDLNDGTALKRSPLSLMSIAGSILVLYLFYRCPWFIYDGTSTTNYISIATHSNSSAVYGAYSVFATMALVLVVLSAIISSYYVFVGNKHVKLVIIILNFSAPIFILLSFICARYQYWNSMGILLALIYVSMDVCHCVIKPLRPENLKASN